MIPNLTKKLQIKVGPSGPDLYLLPSQYITAGGEGAIYRQGNVIYKVYIDGKNHDEMEEKVNLLKPAFSNSLGIVCPNDTLYFPNGIVAGYSMQAVEGEPLVRFFTNDYRTQVNFGLGQTRDLTLKMMELQKQAHYHHALIVDGNEMNYLVHDTKNTADFHFYPSIIDVDSWQIGRFKATAIMASIRDYHAKSFNELTDWFSWAIVTFQLFTGIHPFKGRHPGYKPGDLVGRMKNLVSVFDGAVQLPASVRDIDDIPTQLKDWYRTLFTTTTRELPPAKFDGVIPTKIKARAVVTSGGKINFDKLCEFKEPILQVYPTGQIQTRHAIFARARDDKQVLHSGNTQVEVTTSGKFTIVADNGLREIVVLADGNAQTVNPQLHRHKYLRKDNHLFLVHQTGMTEMRFTDLGVKVICSPGETWDFNYASSFIGNGVVIYDAIGVKFLVLPLEDEGCVVEAAHELMGTNVLAAKAIKGFVTCLVKDVTGQNHKLELTYNERGNRVNHWFEPTDETEINFAMNKNGIVATIVEDGKLVLFSPLNGKKTVIENKHIGTDMKLWSMNGNIVFSRDNELWSISVS